MSVAGSRGVEKTGAVGDPGLTHDLLLPSFNVETDRAGEVTVAVVVEVEDEDEEDDTKDEVDVDDEEDDDGDVIPVITMGGGLVTILGVVVL